MNAPVLTAKEAREIALQRQAFLKDSLNAAKEECHRKINESINTYGSLFVSVPVKKHRNELVQYFNELGYNAVFHATNLIDDDEVGTLLISFYE